MKLTKVKSGHYKYKNFDIFKWVPEQSGVRYLWCVALEGTGLDDFKTLKQVKAHLEADDQKIKP
jgi:hypothetical protein